MTTHSALPHVRDPETLRLYASILEKPHRDRPGGELIGPTIIEHTAAQALRYCADEIEMHMELGDLA